MSDPEEYLGDLARAQAAMATAHREAAERERNAAAERDRYRHLFNFADHFGKQIVVTDDKGQDYVGTLLTCDGMGVWLDVGGYYMCVKFNFMRSMKLPKTAAFLKADQASSMFEAES